MSSTTTPASTPAIVGVAQLRATNDKVHNLLEIAKVAGWAKQKKASMLFLPENCGFMGEAPGETLENAEAPVGEEVENSSLLTRKIETMYKRAYSGDLLEGEETACELSGTQARISLLNGLRTLARASKMWISVGGMHVLGAPPHPETGKARFYNTHVILDDMGIVQAIYRKIHLFDVSIPGKVNLMESNSTAAGKDIVVCDSPVGKLIDFFSYANINVRDICVMVFEPDILTSTICYSGRLGISTCYDMRFPEQYAEMTKKGAQILLMPSAFTVPTGQAHWHILLRGKSINT